MYNDGPKYKGYYRSVLTMYGILFIFAFINYLPRLGVTGDWIPIVVSMGPIILIGWYGTFVRYLVENR